MSPDWATGINDRYLQVYENPPFQEKVQSLSRFNGLSALTFVALALPAHGTPLVLNGSFENIGTATASFSINNPTVLPNWSATPSGNHILDCLVVSTDVTSLCGNAFGGGLTFWINPGASPDGGNFLSVDGDQNYATPITQTIAGLVVGAQYHLTFYQASGQQNGFNGATTEQWSVTLGTENHISTLMTTANHGSIGWMAQTMTFTATSASEVLSFLALGTPNGVPPFVFLDGVSLAQIPEPSTAGLVGLCLMGLPLARRILKKRL